MCRILPYTVSRFFEDSFSVIQKILFMTIILLLVVGLDLVFFRSFLL